MIIRELEIRTDHAVQWNDRGFRTYFGPLGKVSQDLLWRKKHPPDPTNQHEIWTSDASPLHM